MRRNHLGVNLEKECQIRLDQLEIGAQWQRDGDEIEEEREFVAFAHKLHAELAQRRVGARCGLAAQNGEDDVDWAGGWG